MGKNLKFFETKAFLELKNEWYQKLKSDGFIDLEKNYGNNHYDLKQVARYQLRKKISRGKFSFDQIGAHREYYLKLSQTAFSHIFPNKRDQIVLQMHAEGARVIEILKVLEKHEIYCHRQTIRYIIRRYEHQWQIKSWTPKQMTSNKLTA